MIDIYQKQTKQTTVSRRGRETASTTTFHEFTGTLPGSGLVDVGVAVASTEELLGGDLRKRLKILDELGVTLIVVVFV